MYNLNKDFFVNQVVEKEQYLAQQEKLQRLADEKKKESKTLKVRLADNLLN
jgi:hypothetical protein